MLWLVAAPASAVTFDYESGTAGFASQTVTQTIGSDVLRAVSTSDTLDNAANFGGAPFAGSESLFTGGSYFGETQVVFSLTSGKSFDLTSISFREQGFNSETITLTSSKGTATSSLISISGSSTLDVSANTNMQGITSFTMTASPSNFIIAVDNVVLQNIGPRITSATYDASTNVLVVTGAGMTTGDTIDTTKLTLTGQGGGTYTLTSASVTAASASSFSVTLNATDQIGIEGLLNKNGTSSVGGTTYNLAAAANWDSSASAPADLTGNGVTVSNIAVPGAPTGATASAGNTQATVNFTAPASSGSSAIITYTATSSPGGLTGTCAGPAACAITVTGLTNGTGYTFTVTATNASVTGTASAATSSVTPATVPGAPTGVTASAGDTQATINFTAPVSNGGSAITIYTATSSPGGLTGTCAGPAACAITVTGLTNGTGYTFTVTATNAAGTGAASSASNSVTPQASQTITFNNPGAQNFGTTPNLSASATSGLTVTFTSSTTGVCTISGVALTFVTAGTCTINADQAGDSNYLAAPQVSRSFSVNAVVPGAPTIGTPTAGDTQVSVAFTPPAFTGGATITNYTATSNPGGLTGSCAASPCTVTGLTNGVAYTFTVTATNSAGTGSASSASSSVTPTATQTITFNNPGAQNFGTTPTLSATSTSGLTVSFTSSTTGVCTITTGGALTFVTAGTCTINADQAGDSSYLAAPQVSRSFSVNAVVPGAPTIGTASAGNAQATVTFSAPAFTGGATITGYTVTASPGGVTGSGAASPITVTGLTNSTAYTFTVTATNTAGTGSASAASNSVTPAPGPVVQSVAVPANGTYTTGANLDFTVTWDKNTTVTGTPRIALVIGVTTVYANYVSSPSATTSLFRYTVLSGQSDADGIAVGALTLNGGTVRDSNGVDATLTLNSVGVTTGVLVDTSAATLAAANIVVNNQSDPHKVILTFSKNLDAATLGAGNAWTVTANGGTPVYTVAGVSLASGNQVTLTLAAINLTSSATFIRNTDANGHLKVTPPATLKDTIGNTYTAGLVTEAGATHVLDSTAPTLSGVTASSSTLTATASEKARGYWIAVATGAAVPSVAQVKAGVNYAAVTVVAQGNGVLPSGSTGSLSLSGLPSGATYDIYLVAEDAAGNLTAGVNGSSVSTTTPTASAASLQYLLNTPVTLDLAPYITGTSVNVVVAAQHGTTSVSGTQVTYTPSLDYYGTDTFSYVAVSAGGTSTAAVVSVTYNGVRPDPTKDADVIGLVNLQADTARRFWRAQIANFQQRLESRHHAAVPSGSETPESLTETTRKMPVKNDTAGLVATRAPRNAGQPVGDAQTDGPMPAVANTDGASGTFYNFVASSLVSTLSSSSVNLNLASLTGSDRPASGHAGEYEAWTAGNIRIGTLRQPNGGENIDYTTDGVSIGIDKRYSDKLTLGLGMGYARDKSTIGSDGTEASSDGNSITAYGSYQMSPKTFVDGLLGYGTLNLDSTRYAVSANDFARAKRSGSQVYGSLSTGYEQRIKKSLASLYTRYDFAVDRLDESTETGAGASALNYARQSFTTQQLSLGTRAELQYVTDFALIQPRARVEYQRHLEGGDQVSIAYADLLNTRYNLTIPRVDTNSVLLGVGSGLALHNGLQIDLNYQYVRSGAQGHSQTFFFQISKAFGGL